VSTRDIVILMYKTHFHSQPSASTCSIRSWEAPQLIAGVLQGSTVVAVATKKHMPHMSNLMSFPFRLSSHSIGPSSSWNQSRNVLPGVVMFFTT
jgi:hypothetical protein